MSTASPSFVRIQSSLEHVVTFPQLDKGTPKFVSSKQILPKTITVVEKDYIETLMENNAMVKKYFEKGGGMEILTGPGSTPQALPQSLQGVPHDAATTYIDACSDKALLIQWLSNATDGIRDALLARLNIVESEEKRGESAKKK